MLSIKDLKLAYGNKVLFEQANINLYKNQRVGLVGQNGAGKTSLFKMLLGGVLPDSGDYEISNNVTIGYVEQEILDDKQLLVDYVLSVHPLIIEQHIDLPEYYRLQPNAEKLLINLGFKEDELYLPLSSFSGGWQMRANLAKALFIPSDLLLLDEPTNHLDVETVIWLEDWLNGYTGLMLIISHDREFLDNVTTHTLSISSKRLTLYTGNYSTYENTRYLQIEQHEKMLGKSQEKIAHLQKFVDRFKAKASLAKQAQSKMKMIEKLKVKESLPKDTEFSIEFLEPEYVVDKLISIENANFGYTDKLLLKNVNFDIFQNSRVGLLGRNGIGKSTFIKGIIDLSTKISGIIHKDNKIKVGYFAQNTVDQLDLHDTPLSFFIRNNKDKKESELRAYLGRYGFSGDKVKEQIGCFSGGEKARLTIANIIYQRPNILFLDEPTNHLDMHMREELAESIQDYSGGVVIVSHDKFLLQSIVDEFYLIKNQELSKFDGNLDDYHELLLQEEVKVSQKSKVKKKNNNKPDSRNLIKISNDIATTEELIHKINSKIEELSNTIAGIDVSNPNNEAAFNQLTTEYNQNNKKLVELEEKWLQLQTQLDSNNEQS
ncbi:MAG: ABC-F family ATP-binding cassette domain-containing protein [Neisseriaceae bacterium]